jgi:predicted Zn-dependent protease
LFLMLGDIYFKLGKNAEAENAYRDAVYTVPSKFISRKKLADFYRATGNKNAEKIWLQSLIDLPMKIVSPQAEAIKREARERLSIP